MTSVAPRRLVHPALGALLLFAGCRALELILEAQSMASMVGQAILVEWGATQLGVAWSPPETSSTHDVARIAQRIAKGLGVGMLAAALVFGTLVASRAVMVESVRQMQVSVIGLGLLSAGLQAWRDELLFHGLVLRAIPANHSTLLRIIACGVASAGAALGRNDASARSVVVAIFLGTIFGALWVRDQGAWRPWAAHTGFRFAIGTLLAGGVVHSRLAANSWGGGSGGMLGGGAAVLGLAPLAVIALVGTLQAERARAHFTE